MTFVQFISILRARWKFMAAVVLATVATALVVSLMLPKRYTASASMVVDVKPDPVAGAVFGGMLNPAIMATQVDILTSDRVARRVIRNLKLAESAEVRQRWMEATGGVGTIEDWLADQFRQQLDVKPSRESNVITISYQSADPVFAATLANAFIQAFIDTSVDLRVDPARQYSGFFDKRAKEARDVLEAKQTRLSEFQRANGITINDERMDVETARLNELANQLVLMQTMATDSSSRQAQVAGGNSDRLNEAINNPVIAGLRVDLSRAQANLQELNSRLGANNPQVQQAKANIAELRSRIEAETQRVAGSIGVTARINSARVGEVRAQLDAQRAKVAKLKESRDAMAVLQRDVENAQSAYDAVVGRYNQANLESQAQQSNVNLLSQATPPLLPSFPKKTLNVALALVLGSMLAVGLALLRELLDRRVRSAKDVVDALGLPILGVMPKPNVRRHSSTLMAQRVVFGRLPPPSSH